MSTTHSAGAARPHSRAGYRAVRLDQQTENTSVLVLCAVLLRSLATGPYVLERKR